jgi:hypothetical protein
MRDVGELECGLLLTGVRIPNRDTVAERSEWTDSTKIDRIRKSLL